MHGQSEELLARPWVDGQGSIATPATGGSSISHQIFYNECVEAVCCIYGMLSQAVRTCG